jgi:hypothetical protein
MVYLKLEKYKNRRCKMKIDKNSKVLLSSFFIGLLIMFSPVIITGHGYDVSRVMGILLTVELIVRTLALIIGLIVIYDGVKCYVKKE